MANQTNISLLFPTSVVIVVIAVKEVGGNNDNIYPLFTKTQSFEENIHNIMYLKNAHLRGNVGSEEMCFRKTLAN